MGAWPDGHAPFSIEEVSVDKQFNYKYLFDQALVKIKSVRDPRATRADLSDFRWHEVEQEIMFDFEGGALRKYENIADAANKITISCLHFMIINLMLDYDYQVSEIKMQKKQQDGLLKSHLFTLVNKNAKELLIFKSIEECPFSKLPDREPEEIQGLMKTAEAESCKYIYFLFDKAYLQLVGHNADESDPGRGFNVFSIKDYFKAYFGDDEYSRFEAAFKDYIREANDYIGYGIIKTLSKNSLLTFRKVTENEILIFSYEDLMGIRAKQYELDESEFNKIRKQFIEEKRFLVMLGSGDFAESLITAEWLRDSMKKAQAIDLTAIAMGYFKAVEQLLYEILEVKGCDGLTEESNLGAMAHVFKDNIENTDLIRSDLFFPTRKYIRESIFDYKDLRNGYLHRHNIHDWEKIEHIRQASFNMVFLLLGGCNLSEAELSELGYSEEAFTDYYRLCEYVNFHSGELFYLDFADGREETMWISVADRNARLDGNKTVYSGVYFKELSGEGKIWGFREEHLPKRISLGKFVFANTIGIGITPVKIKTVFEDGKFVGPSIAEEEKLDY